MSENFIQIIPNAISESDCVDIIEAFEKKSEHFSNETQIDGIHVDITEYRNDISMFPSNFQSMEASVELICDTIKQHTPLHWEGNDDHWMYLQNIKIQKASEGGGFTQLHVEQGSSASTSSRFMVWMIYLNETVGGETLFPLQELSVKPKAGTLLYWPAAYTHPHAAANNLKSDKYITTGWFSYSQEDNTYYFKTKLQSKE